MSSLAGVTNTIRAYMPSKKQCGQVAKGAAMGVAVAGFAYAYKTLFALSIVAMQTAYPSILFRAVPLAYCAYQKYKGKESYKDGSINPSKVDKINTIAQKFACVALVAELAFSVLFPASAAGRLIVQGVVITASATGNLSAVKTGFEAVKKGMKDSRTEEKTTDIVAGLIMMGLGIYGGFETYNAAARLYRYDSPQSPTTEAADTQLQPETAPESAPESTDVAPQPTDGKEMEITIKTNANVKHFKVKLPHVPGQGRHVEKIDVPVDGEIEPSIDETAPHMFPIERFRRCGHAALYRMMRVTVTPATEEGGFKTICITIFRAICRKGPIAPIAPIAVA